jgi:hypothetical protein
VNKTFLGILLAVFVMLTINLSPRGVVAQSNMDLQPGVVISLSHVNEHLSDVEHLIEASGFGQFKGLVRMSVSEYIKGIDVEKPIGAMLFFEEGNPEPNVLGFIPVTDIEDVLDTIAPFVDIDGDDGKYVLTTDDGTEMSVSVVDGYAFVSENSELLENLPADPSGLLDNLPSEYNFAARVYGQRIPEDLRQQAIDLVRQGAAENMVEGDDSPEAMLQRANFEYSMESIEGLINDTEEVVAGLNIDADGKRIYVDIKFVGTPDSDLARQCKTMAEAPPSRFGGFVNDSASLNFNFCGKFGEKELVQFQTMLDEVGEAAKKGLSDEVEAERMTGDEADSLTKVLENLIEVARDSFATGVVDGGGALVLSDEDANFAFGMQAVNASKLESSLKELAQMAEAKDAPMSFNFDASNENGIRYHEMEISVPEDEEEARAIFGDALKVTVGIGEDVVYVAGGKDPKKLLADCIAGAAPADMPCTQFNLHLIPLLRFASSFQDSQELQMVADALPETGDDRIRMTAKMIENGQLIRLEMQDGIVEIFGKVGQAMGGGFGGPPQDF